MSKIPILTDISSVGDTRYLIRPIRGKRYTKKEKKMMIDMMKMVPTNPKRVHRQIIRQLLNEIIGDYLMYEYPATTKKSPTAITMKYLKKRGKACKG